MKSYLHANGGIAEFVISNIWFLLGKIWLYLKAAQLLEMRLHRLLVPMYEK